MMEMNCKLLKERPRPAVARPRSPNYDNHLSPGILEPFYKAPTLEHSTRQRGSKIHPARSARTCSSVSRGTPVGFRSFRKPNLLKNPGSKEVLALKQRHQLLHRCWTPCEVELQGLLYLCDQCGQR